MMVLASLLIALPLIPAGVLYLLATRVERERARSGRRNPITQKLLRTPGESIKRELKERQLDLLHWLLVIVIAGPTAGAVAFGSWAVSGNPDWRLLALATLGFVSACGYAAARARKILRETLWLQVGLDAEEAIGQELNHLMASGFQVFHDVPGDNFNIDHVVVGLNGLFVVETKGRSKSPTGYRVEFDGRVLGFPGWRETKPVEQVVMTSRWLEKWIQRRTGHEVVANPVLAIAGWYIERTTGDRSVLTVSGGEKDLAGILDKFCRKKLTAEQVRDVSARLEEICRDVAPRAYGKPEPVH